MKKLSDYRIREENGKFVVEGRIEITERRFLRKLVNFEWHGLNVYGEVAGFCHQIDGSNVKIYTTLEDAKAQIIKWCDEQKYHYVREVEAYADKCIDKAESEMIGIIDTALAQVKKSFKCFPCDLSDIAKTEQQMKEEITEQDVIGACKKQFDEKLPSFKDCGRKSLCTLSDEAPDTLFINEALKINPLFYKLVEKYEEKIKIGWNPKTIEKSYADLVLENFELTIKNKELEIQLHELKKKQTKNDKR